MYAIRSYYDRIKINFYKKHRANIETEKAAFLADGGAEEEQRIDQKELHLQETDRVV